MKQESDIDIRYEGIGGILYVLIGFAVGGFGIFVANRIAKPMQGEGSSFHPIMVVPILLGLGLIIYGAVRLFDKGIKLSLTTEGLKDRRTGVFVKWTDFRGVRLYVKTTNGWQSSAEMFVKVANKDGEHEIGFDVHSLERSHEEIANLVQKRGIAAGQSEADSESMLARVLAEALTDVMSGIPTSFVVNKLTKRGVDPEFAAQVIRMTISGSASRCTKCNLDYHTSITTCGSCGNELSRVAPDENDRAPVNPLPGGESQ